jgi:hypothetical protein
LRNGAAAALALDGVEDRCGRRAAGRRGADHLEAALRTQVRLQFGQALVKSLQIFHPGMKVGSPPCDEGRQRRRGRIAMSRMAPRREAGGLLQRQVDASQVEEQPQMIGELTNA